MPPQTPFQPGASPSPPLSPLGAGLGGLLLLGQGLWSLLNQKPEPGPPRQWTDEDGLTVMFGEYRAFFLATQWVANGSYTYCTDPPSSFSSSAGPSAVAYWGVFGYGIRMNAAGTSLGWGCQGGGFNGTLGDAQVLGENGEVTATLGPFFSGSIGFGGGSGNLTIGFIVSLLDYWTNAPYDLGPGAPGEWPGDWMEEDLPEAPPLVESVPLLAPLAVPAPAAAPAAAPGGQPVPAPAAAPGGAPSPAPGGVTTVTTITGPRPAPAVTPTLPQAVPVTPAGPIVVAPPVTVPPTPADAVVVGGQIIGGPGQSPAPNMQAMAAELGRLERKAELTLEGGATAVAVEALAELLQDLIGRLLAITPGTTYTIQPPCGTKPEGGPLDPVEVIAPGGDTPEAAIINRLDALAMLIDEHKRIRQPICKGKPTGEPVTVTFVEADP